MAKKILRNLDTEENRRFWELPPAAKDIESWPAWRLAGVTVPYNHDGLPVPGVKLPKR